VTDATIAREREAVLPRTARDQRELAEAIDDVRTASRDAARRVMVWTAVVLVLMVAGISIRRLA
jgi:hypothetical protein